MKCHNYQKLGHFARECWYGEGAKNRPKNKANLAQDEDSSDSDVVMLMAKTNSTDSEEKSSWYLDSGCSTHLGLVMIVA